jgi:UTP--glucose-1-phosphate uridylyltransferase
MKIRKAVFPAAGLGTRFLPATKSQPKEMLPLVDKPVIQYVIEEAMASGIEDIIIVTGRGKNAIEDHFDVSYELEKILESRGKTDLLEQVRAISKMVSISYVRQKEALGLGHAILVAKPLVGDEPFAVLLGDDIIDAEVPCTQQMISVFEKHQSSVLATQIVEGPDISLYGVIKGKPVEDSSGSGRIYRVDDLVEKPPYAEAPSNLAIIGRYILTPEIFDVLEQTRADKGGEIQLTNGLRLLREKQLIHAYRFEGKRYDAGDKLGFLKATVEFALKREDLGSDFAIYLRELLNSGALQKKR